MSKRDRQEQESEKNRIAASRRDFMKGSVVVGAGLAGVGAGTATLDRFFGGEAHAATTGGGLSADVPPGKLDDYYGFWSGGQSGEIRILGVPSMRELKRIPVFNRDSATGWGARRLVAGSSATGWRCGDTHHVHLSYTDGTYDGRYVYVNDKANARLARVRCDIMEVDAITDIPNSQGTHGIFPQRHKTGLVLCNCRVPHAAAERRPRSGRPEEVRRDAHRDRRRDAWRCKWQVMVEGNMDLCATDYEGKYSFATCYNSEERRQPRADDGRRPRLSLRLQPRRPSSQAVKAGKTIRVGKSPVPVVDARGDNGPYVQRIPDPQEPARRQHRPDGQVRGLRRQALAHGHRRRHRQARRAVRRQDQAARHAWSAEPEVGLGPLHTAFDGRGNAYTSIFIDSVMTKWNIAKAIEAYNDEIGRSDPPEARRPLPGRPHQRLDERDEGRRRQVAGRALQVLEGSLPATSARCTPRTTS